MTAAQHYSLHHLAFYLRHSETRQTCLMSQLLLSQLGCLYMYVGETYLRRGCVVCRAGRVRGVV